MEVYFILKARVSFIVNPEFVVLRFATDISNGILWKYFLKGKNQILNLSPKIFPKFELNQRIDILSRYT